MNVKAKIRFGFLVQTKMIVEEFATRYLFSHVTKQMKLKQQETEYLPAIHFSIEEYYQPRLYLNYDALHCAQVHDGRFSPMLIVYKI